MPIFKSDEFLLNILPKKRLLGIDPGTKTLGIAVSDSNLMVASPITTIKRKKINIDIRELLILVEEYTIAGIVFGWPLNMDGSIGPRCDSVRDFIKSLLNIKDLPILLH
jgi:putative Holliday junction resolvase